VAALEYGFVVAHIIRRVRRKDHARQKCGPGAESIPAKAALLPQQKGKLNCVFDYPLQRLNKESPRPMGSVD